MTSSPTRVRGPLRGVSAATPDPRKKPSQQRSRETVDAILEATARILREGGFAKATTNRIAARAGVSVGSLYQYFPSKEALVTALIEQHRTAMVALLHARKEAMLHAPVDHAVHAVVEGIVAVHAHDPLLHKVLVEHVLRNGGHHAERMKVFEDQATDMLRSWLESRRGDLPIEDPDTVVFMLVRMVEALTHAAVLERMESYSKETLTAHIAAAVLGYLRAACAK